MTVRTLDHFLILVEPLEPAVAIYAQLGFHVRPIAKHEALGSANSVIHLKNTYLELLFLGDSTPAINAQYRPRFAAGPGLANVSLQSNSLEADTERLKAAGLTTYPILNARRKIVRPDGTPDYTASSSFYFWREEHRYMSLFHSVHDKPDTIFIEAYTHHANTVHDVTRLVYMSDDPAEDLAYFTTVYEGAPASTGPEGFSFVGPRGEVTEVTTIARATERYGKHLPSAGLGGLGGLPVALHYSTASIEACSAHLKSHNVGHSAFGQGLIVAADEACGVSTVFEPLAR